jgi:hypothetical protein
MAGILQLLLDHNDTHLLIACSRSASPLCTPLSGNGNLHQLNTLGCFNPTRNTLSSTSHPNFQFPVFPETASFTSLFSSPSPSLSFLTNFTPSPSLSTLQPMDLSFFQGSTTSTQESASGVQLDMELPMPASDLALSPDVSNFHLRLLAEVATATQSDQAGVWHLSESPIVVSSPLFGFAPCSVSPLAALPNGIIQTSLISSFTATTPSVGNKCSQPDAPLELPKILSTSSPASSPFSSSARVVLAGLSGNDEIEHRSTPLPSYISSDSRSHPYSPSAPQMRFEIVDPRERFNADSTIDSEATTLFIEKQQTIRRPRRFRSASNSLPQATTRYLRTQTQARAVSVNIASPPLPRPLSGAGISDAENTDIPVFKRARNTKARTVREVAPIPALSLIHWEMDGPRPRPTRAPRNKASQTNLTLEADKENQATIESASPTCSEE